MVSGIKINVVMAILMLLLDGLACGIPSKMTPIKIAAEKGDLNALRQLIGKGVDPNGTLEHGFTPLHCAVRRGQYEAAKILLEAGASPNCWRYEAHAIVEGTPLHQAAYFGNVRLAKLLLDHGANVNIVPEFPDTTSYSPKGMPLHEAVAKGHLDMVQLLISHGANVNARGIRDRQSPLYLAKDKVIAEYLTVHGAKLSLYDAVLANDVPKVKNLLALGEDVHQAEESGYTVLHLAAAKGRLEIAKILLENGARLSEKRNYTPLVEAAYHNQAKMAEMLIEYGAVVDIKLNKCTPLYYALEHDRTETARVLIKHGANVNATVCSPSGDSLLHYCVMMSRPKATRLLLEHGANPNAVNPRGTSVLKYGLMWNRYRHKEIPELLIEYGAKNED